MKGQLIVMGIVAGITVAGCSSDGSESSTKGPRTPTTTTTTTGPAFVANTQNTPGTLKNFVGAHADVSDTKCEPADGSWSATGIITNPTKQAAKYRIYVSFLDGDTTVGVAQTDVNKVDATASSEWTATVGATGTNLRCILRVERASA